MDDKLIFIGTEKKCLQCIVKQSKAGPYILQKMMPSV